MGIMALGAVDFPTPVTETQTLSWTKESIEGKAWAFLTCGRIAERICIPLTHRFRQPRRNQSAQTGVAALQRGISSAMVTVQVCVQEQLKTASSQAFFHQRERLIGVAAVA